MKLEDHVCGIHRVCGIDCVCSIQAVILRG